MGGRLAAVASSVNEPLTACVADLARQHRTVIHCNHAGSSWPKPPGVAKAMQHALVAAPTEHAALYAQAHAAIVDSFGLPAPERLLLTSSCTQALGLVFADLPWQPGDVVITSSLEHHALARPVQKLAHERGVVHVRARYRPGLPIDLGVVEAALRAGRVRLVAVTGASNITGERLPIAEIAALAHDHGALLLLDAAQLAGVVPFTVAELGVDILVFAGHKGMYGPLGIGGFWASPAVEFACPSAACELGDRAMGAFRPYPGFCDVGSVNLPGACGLAAAVAWLAALPLEQRERPLAMAARLRGLLRERPYLPVLGGDGPHTATLSLRLSPARLAAAQVGFERRGIVVRAGLHCAPWALAALAEPAGCLRISFGPTNDWADVDAVMAGLESLAAMAR